MQAERTILENAVTGASIVPFVYGGLLAWALFSWLFRTNSAYFYAALPVRRRTLFLTNYLTGLLLCAAGMRRGGRAPRNAGEGVEDV